VLLNTDYPDLLIFSQGDAYLIYKKVNTYCIMQCFVFDLKRLLKRVKEWCSCAGD
jgi:hypothetical protein